jgi:hypothetical protein
LANFMRFSLWKAAHAVMSSAAWQEIRVRSGRDDKGEGSVPVDFIPLGGPLIVGGLGLLGVGDEDPAPRNLLPDADGRNGLHRPSGWGKL